jgi:hypothetical protein
MSEREKHSPPADEEELRRAEEDAARYNATLMEVAPDKYEEHKVTPAGLIEDNRRREADRIRLVKENQGRVDGMWRERIELLKGLAVEELKTFYQVTAESLEKRPPMIDISGLTGKDKETRMKLSQAMQVNIAAEMHDSHIPDMKRTLALIKQELEGRGLHNIVQELERKNKVAGQN